MLANLQLLVYYLSLLRQAGLVPRKVALISQSVDIFRWLLVHTYYKYQVRIQDFEMGGEFL